MPNIPYKIHRDQHTLTDFPKINWVFGNAVSQMNWYTILSEGAMNNTGIGTAFVGYDLKDVELLYSTEIASPSLVQAGVPHNVTIVEGFRWAVSTVYRRNNKLLTFEEMVETFKPFLI
jgi:hypothetical protein